MCSDRQRLRQVLLNLLSNAGEVQPADGSVHVRSRATSTSEDHRPRYRNGIPDEKLALELFVAFDAWTPSAAT